MIDLLLAEKNINKYKFDYNGYLVIIDKIRTKEIIENGNLKAMQNHLKMLKNKYKVELKRIAFIEQKETKSINIYRLNKKQLVNELSYIYDRLPAIGHIILGLEKEIGIF